MAYFIINTHTHCQTPRIISMVAWGITQMSCQFLPASLSSKSAAPCTHQAKARAQGHAPASPAAACACAHETNQKKARIRTEGSRDVACVRAGIHY